MSLFDLRRFFLSRDPPYVPPALFYFSLLPLRSCHQRHAELTLLVLLLFAGCSFFLNPCFVFLNCRFLLVRASRAFHPQGRNVCFLSFLLPTYFRLLSAFSVFSDRPRNRVPEFSRAVAFSVHTSCKEAFPCTFFDAPCLTRPPPGEIRMTKINFRPYSLSLEIPNTLFSDVYSFDLQRAVRSYSHA